MSRILLVVICTWILNACANSSGPRKNSEGASPSPKSSVETTDVGFDEAEDPDEDGDDETNGVVEAPVAPERTMAWYVEQVFPASERKRSKATKFVRVDETQGYARLTGDAEGYFDFFVFKGAKSDVVVQVSYVCEPSCSQAIEAFRIDQATKEVTKEKFTKVFSPEAFAGRKTALKTCVSDDGDFRTVDDGEATPCYIFFSLPKTGGDITVFSANDYIEEGTRIEPLAELAWNGQTFAVKKRVKNAKAIQLTGKNFDLYF